MKTVNTFLLLFVLQHFFASAQVIELNHNATSINLGDKIEYIETKYNELSANEALSKLFKPHTKKLFFSGWHNMNTCYWIKFSYTCNGNINAPFSIELDNALIAEIKYYVFSGNALIDSNTAGDGYPFNNRKLANRNFIYGLPFKNGETFTVLFQVYNEGRNFHTPLSIKSAITLYKENYQKQLVYGIFFGIMFIIILYNITLFLLIKEKIYLWLSLFVASFALLQLVFSGYAFQYICPNQPWLADKLCPVSTAISSILAIQFSKHFFNGDLGSLWINRFAKIWQCILFVAAFSVLGGGWFSFYTIWALYYLFTVTYIIILAVSVKNLVSKGRNYARFFMGAIIVFVISATCINLYANGEFIEENIFTNNSILFGMLVIFSAISISVFDRLLLIKNQKEKAQAEAINSLEELNYLKEQNNRTLEQKVNEKTQELLSKQAQLNIALIAGEEQERKRFSQELHDGLGSMLSTIKLNMAASQQKNYNNQLEHIIEMIDKACDEVRAISHNLTPPMFEKFGLVRSLQDIANRINETSHLTCHFDAEAVILPFNYTVQLSIYRIIMELINNVIKHANAGKLYVQLFVHDDFLNIIIEDDGIGIAEASANNGIGFSNIRYRLNNLKGTINIDSHKEKGTIVIIQIPTTGTLDHG